MSKYFQALNRMSQQQAREEQVGRYPDGTQPGSVGSHELERPDVLLGPSPFANLPLAKRQRAYSILLDSLRSAGGSSPLPCCVLAGISRSGSVTATIMGLQAEAQDQGLRLLALQVGVDGSERYLRELETGSNPISGRGKRPPNLDLGSNPSGDQVEAWLRNVEGELDLVAIQAPPLGESVEAALVGRQCDGLVVFVENLSDSQTDLQSALDKVRDAGCPILGVVLCGARRWLPKWLERVFKGESSSKIR